MHNLQFYCVLMMGYADRYKYYNDVPVFSTAFCRWNIGNGLLTLNLLAPTTVGARINPQATNGIYIWSTHF